MLPYWIMFCVPAVVALMPPKTGGGQPWTRSARVAVWIALTLAIGYRYEVGGDWINYLRSFDRFADEPLIFASESPEPGYFLLNWVASRAGLGIYGVNLFCGALFAAGLVGFCGAQTRPWLALTVAVPYLVIVVAMGYSRQGVAAGLAMLGLVALSKGRKFSFVVWVFLGALIHKSAIVLLPLAIMASKQGRIWTAVWVGGTGVLLFRLLLEDYTDAFVVNYIEASYSSEGALVRVAMNATAAVVFLALRSRFELDAQTRRLWTWMSGISILALVALAVSPSSTAVDRIALYFIPIQIFVFSRVPDLAGLRGGMRSLSAAGVLISYAVVQAVWLNFAVHAWAWLPYRFYPIEVLLQPRI